MWTEHFLSVTFADSYDSRPTTFTGTFDDNEPQLTDKRTRTHTQPTKGMLVGTWRSSSLFRGEVDGNLDILSLTVYPLLEWEDAALIRCPLTTRSLGSIGLGFGAHEMMLRLLDAELERAYEKRCSMIAVIFAERVVRILVDAIDEFAIAMPDV